MEKNTLGVLSTAHVSRASAKWLDTQGLMAADKSGMPALNIGSGEYGWFIWCPLETDYIDANVPADVREVIIYARTNNCAYVYLDRDAELVSDLPVYDW